MMKNRTARDARVEAVETGDLFAVVGFSKFCIFLIPGQRERDS